jgi:hypothetical protein
MEVVDQYQSWMEDLGGDESHRVLVWSVLERERYDRQRGN